MLRAASTAPALAEPLNSGLKPRNTSEVLAADLRARHQHLRLPDAVVLATAARSGRDLLTYDDRLAKLTD